MNITQMRLEAELEQLAAASRSRRLEALQMLPHAQAISKALGPFKAANGSSAWGLAMAYANCHWLTAKWCGCRVSLKDEDMYYFARQTGEHGWFCPKCGGYYQIG